MHGPDIPDLPVDPPRAPVHFRRATLADAEALSSFARRTFAETFGPHNDPRDMAVYAERAFTPSAQGAELADASRVCLVGERDGAIVAYALLHDGASPPAVAGSRPLEIERFYVDARWHGAGVSGAMMDRVVDTARSLGCETLWLGVWERNPRAIRFYARRGFLDVGSQGFQLGTDLQTDRVMMRDLTLARADNASGVAGSLHEDKERDA
jgi:GNAT superfamily N-acetyltransferase